MSFRGGMNEFVRQAARMQRKIEARREELKAEEFEASAGNDRVKAKVNGALELVALQIDSKLIEEEGLEMTQDLVVAAANAALAKARETIDAEAVKRLIGQFNEVLRDIFMAVATYGGMDQTRATLEAWIHGSGYAPIFGEHVDEDGSIPAEPVVEALAQVNVENPMEGLQQALHELSAFALFAATTTLPRDQELTLSRDVNTRLKRIRL